MTSPPTLVAALLTDTQAHGVLDALLRLHIVTITAAYVEAVVDGRDAAAAYRVRCGPGERYACSCPRATYGVRRGEPCKHAQALRLAAGALPTLLKGDWA